MRLKVVKDGEKDGKKGERKQGEQNCFSIVRTQLKLKLCGSLLYSAAAGSTAATSLPAPDEDPKRWEVVEGEEGKGGERGDGRGGKIGKEREDGVRKEGEEKRREDGKSGEKGR